MIIRDGIERMYGPEPEDCFYYLTLYNENYPMPAMPDGRRGRHRARACTATAAAPEPRRTHRAQILASGTAMLAALDAQQILADEYDVAADVWSATSYKLLREDALSVERWNRLHPTEPARTPYVTELLARQRRARSSRSTDFMKAVPDQIARFVPRPFTSLGTDGYGFSDTRVALRRHFEVDAPQHRGRGAARPRADRGDQGRGGAGGDHAASTSTPTAPTPAYLTPASRRRTRRFWRRDRAQMARRSSSLQRVVVEGVVVPLVVVDSSSSSSSASASRSTSARVPEPSRNRPSSKPCFSSRASRNRRARPFLGTWSPALQDSELWPVILPQPELRRVQFEGDNSLPERPIPVTVEMHHFAHRLPGGRAVPSPAASPGGPPPPA